MSIITYQQSPLHHSRHPQSDLNLPNKLMLDFSDSIFHLFTLLSRPRVIPLRADGFADKALSAENAPGQRQPALPHHE